MPNTKSAKKRLRQDTQRRNRNRSVKSGVRGQVRKVREAVKSGNTDLAEEEFRLAAKKLDRAGARKIIHPNAVARTKSRLQKAIRSAKQSAS